MARDRVHRTDIHISKRSQPFPEFLDIRFIRFHLLAFRVLAAALFLGMEAQILKQYHLSTRSRIDCLLDLRAHTIFGEGDLFAQQFFEFRDHGLQAILGVGLAIGSAEVGHQDDSFGAMVYGVFDGWNSAYDTLGICDILFRVEGNIEIDLSVLRLSTDSTWRLAMASQ